MDAAIEVFYDMVSSYYPEAISPSYQSFYEAAIGAEEKKAELKDLYTELNMHTLSSTLVGIEQQAMSYRRDIIDNDYPTEFYEKICMPEDYELERLRAVDPRGTSEAEKYNYTHVQMERTYLNGWQTFVKRTE